MTLFAAKNLKQKQIYALYNAFQFLITSYPIAQIPSSHSHQLVGNYRERTHEKKSTTI